MSEHMPTRISTRMPTLMPAHVSARMSTHMPTSPNHFRLVAGPVSALHRLCPTISVSVSARYRLCTGPASALHRIRIRSVSTVYRLCIGMGDAPYRHRPQRASRRFTPHTDLPPACTAAERRRMGGGVPRRAVRRARHGAHRHHRQPLAHPSQL